VCCTVAPLADGAIRKGPNTVCPASTGRGCSIYRDRPTACRESFCGWRFYPELDDSWRPDLSGVLILTEQDAPGAGRGKTGIKLLLVHDDAPLSDPRVIGYLVALARRGVPLSLSVQGPAGCWPVKTFLNAALAPAIARADAAEVAQVLLRTSRALRGGAFETAEF